MQKYNLIPTILIQKYSVKNNFQVIIDKIFQV